MRRDDAFYADANLISEAVRRDARISAYLATGGSDGCAQCKGLTFAQRVERDHLSCAEALAATAGAQRTAAGLSEVWISVSRVMKDPRFGQWMHAEAGA